MMASSNANDNNIKVAVRIRPRLERETKENFIEYWSHTGNSISSLLESRKTGTNSLVFDSVFGVESTNKEVFEKLVHPIVQDSLEGYNGTVFAYGQTASGKTYTMSGDRQNPGIIPLAVNFVFSFIDNTPERTYLLRVSFIEIYNEIVTDLLAEQQNPLRIFEDKDGMPYIGDLTEIVVTSASELLSCIRKGELRRQFGETSMNERSSRSHTIFKMVIESHSDAVSVNDDDESIVISHLNLVDLAGSEKCGQIGLKQARFKEGCSINLSLLALTQVISKLSEGNTQFINFRDSNLTRILKPSLGGNSKTAIVCTITPVVYEESLSTLKFADRARSVKNKPRINAILSKDSVLKRYENEIHQLKIDLQKENKSEELRKELQEKDSRIFELQEKLRTLNEKLLNSSISFPIFCETKKGHSRRETWSGILLSHDLKVHNINKTSYSPSEFSTSHNHLPLTVELDEDNVNDCNSILKKSGKQNDVATQTDENDEVFEDVLNLDNLDCSPTDVTLFQEKGVKMNLEELKQGEKKPIEADTIQLRKDIDELREKLNREKLQFEEDLKIREQTSREEFITELTKKQNEIDMMGEIVSYLKAELVKFENAKDEKDEIFKRAEENELHIKELEKKIEQLLKVISRNEEEPDDRKGKIQNSEFQSRVLELEAEILNSKENFEKELMSCRMEFETQLQKKMKEIEYENQSSESLISELHHEIVTLKEELCKVAKALSHERDTYQEKLEKKSSEFVKEIQAINMKHKEEKEDQNIRISVLENDVTEKERDYAEEIETCRRTLKADFENRLSNLMVQIEVSETINDLKDEVIRRLESSANQELPDNAENVQETVNELVDKLNAEVEKSSFCKRKYEEEIALLIEKNEKALSDLAQLEKQSNEQQDKLDSALKMNDEKEENIQAQLKALSQMKEEREELLESRNTLEDTVKELLDKVNTEIHQTSLFKNKYEEEIARLQQEKQNELSSVLHLEEQAKEQIQKMQQSLDAEMKKNDEKEELIKVQTKELLRMKEENQDLETKSSNLQTHANELLGKLNTQVDQSSFCKSRYEKEIDRLTKKNQTVVSKLLKLEKFTQEQHEILQQSLDAALKKNYEKDELIENNERQIFELLEEKMKWKDENEVLEMKFSKERQELQQQIEDLTKSMSEHKREIDYLKLKQEEKRQIYENELRMLNDRCIEQERSIQTSKMENTSMLAETEQIVAEREEIINQLRDVEMKLEEERNRNKLEMESLFYQIERLKIEKQDCEQEICDIQRNSSEMKARISLQFEELENKNKEIEVYQEKVSQANFNMEKDNEELKMKYEKQSQELQETGENINQLKERVEILEDVNKEMENQAIRTKRRFYEVFDEEKENHEKEKIAHQTTKKELEQIKELVAEALDGQKLNIPSWNKCLRTPFQSTFNQQFVKQKMLSVEALLSFKEKNEKLTIKNEQLQKSISDLQQKIEESKSNDNIVQQLRFDLLKKECELNEMKIHIKKKEAPLLTQIEHLKNDCKGYEHKMNEMKREMRRYHSLDNTTSELSSLKKSSARK